MSSNHSKPQTPSSKRRQTQQQSTETTEPTPAGEPSFDNDAWDDDAHPDSPPGSRRDQIEDPERGGGAEDHSQLI